MEHRTGLCWNLEAILIALEHRKMEESDWSESSPTASCDLFAPQFLFYQIDLIIVPTSGFGGTQFQCMCKVSGHDTISAQ